MIIFEFYNFLLIRWNTFKEKIPLNRIDLHYSQIPYLHTFYLLKFMFRTLSQSFIEVWIHRIAKNLSYFMCTFPGKVEQGDEVLPYCFTLGAYLVLFWGVILLFIMAHKHSAEILVRVPEFKEAMMCFITCVR